MMTLRMEMMVTIGPPCTLNVFPHCLMKFGESSFVVLFRMMRLQVIYNVAGAETLAPPLEITALHTEHVSVLLAGFSLFSSA